MNLNSLSKVILSFLAEVN